MKPYLLIFQVSVFFEVYGDHISVDHLLRIKAAYIDKDLSENCASIHVRLSALQPSLKNLLLVLYFVKQLVCTYMYIYMYI
jgi:hypothetical protein